MAFLKKRRGVLDGVCITGGEPLMSKEVFELAHEIKSLGYLVKLDTNGSYPDRLREMISEGVVDYIAMDIKSSLQAYNKACGTDIDINTVKRSVEIIKSSGVKHEFRTTVVKGIHTARDISECAEWIGEGERYFLQSYKSSDDIIAPDGLSAFSDDELKAILDEARKVNFATELRGVE